MKTAIDNEKKSNTLCQYEVDKLRLIIDENRKYKEKWKNVFIEITKRLETKVRELMIENQELKRKHR